MNIKERINGIKEYFKEMQIVPVDNKQVIYVTVNFPQGWEIDSSLEEKYDITIERGNYPTEYYFFADIENGEDTVFDAIEDNIKKMKNAIERAQLLRVKVTELTKLFQDENITLDELHNLKFVWDKTEDKLIKNIMPENGMIVVHNDSISASVSSSVSSNVQGATTSAEVERQYTSENTKSNKKSKK